MLLSPGGEIGRRTILRGWRLNKAWQFESAPGHNESILLSEKQFSIEVYQTVITLRRYTAGERT